VEREEVPQMRTTRIGSTVRSDERAGEYNDNY
jgi:hypothetical protein